MKTQAECLASYVNNAIYTPNECRHLLNLSMIEGGDILMCNGSYIPVTQVGKQYEQGGDKIEK